MNQCGPGKGSALSMKPNHLYPFVTGDGWGCTKQQNHPTPKFFPPHRIFQYCMAGFLCMLATGAGKNLKPKLVHTHGKLVMEEIGPHGPRSKNLWKA